MNGAGSAGRGVLGILRVTCHVSLVTLFFFSATVMAETAPKDYAKLTEQLELAVARCRELAARALGYDVVFRRDPLKVLVDAQGGLVSSSGMQGGLSIDGIIWSEEAPLAIVDDELVPPGATVGPYTIMQIHPDRVVVKRGHELLSIPLDRGLVPEAESPVSPPSS